VVQVEVVMVAGHLHVVVALPVVRGVSIPVVEVVVEESTQVEPNQVVKVAKVWLLLVGQMHMRRLPQLLER
jgi:hypothetical protein